MQKSKSYKPILIISGDPESIFYEIFFKSLKKKYKSPIILISSLKILRTSMKRFNFKKKINLINYKNLNSNNLNNKSLNIIDVPIDKVKKQKKKITSHKEFIEKSFQIALELIKKNFTYKFINGPISKDKFLNKKYPGITEYIAKKDKSKSSAMLIYNEKLSVCPITTHLPIKEVPKKITKESISEKIYLINAFFKKFRGKKPKIGVIGLNPHCESTDKFNEDEKIIKPTIKKLKKSKYKITGPISADTIFLSQNRSKYDVIIGMYHDQVLSPLKAIYEFNAINITLGLTFLRISPDHGPNKQMIGKNISNPESLIKAIKFLDKN